jgi:hypothetical protein
LVGCRCAANRASANHRPTTASDYPAGFTTDDGTTHDGTNHRAARGALVEPTVGRLPLPG